MYYVYILKSQKDGKFYIGQTCNLTNRLYKHNNALVKSTKFRKPFILIYTEQYKTHKEAVNREKKLKSYKGGEAFKKLIDQKGHPALPDNIKWMAESPAHCE